MVSQKFGSHVIGLEGRGNNDHLLRAALCQGFLSVKPSTIFRRVKQFQMVRTRDETQEHLWEISDPDEVTFDQ